MKSVRLAAGVVVGCVAIGAGSVQFASADWPQWRGANRDGRADFKAPAQWPKELKPAWKVTVGDGVATPALVGGKVYVFRGMPCPGYGETSSAESLRLGRP